MTLSSDPLSTDPLSIDQRRAVERTGQDVCVVAGPGSGKTRVLIERFAWLVERRGVDPSRILAITFTEKAATEIKQRLIDRFAGRAELREAIERAWVSTIHGFCARLLRENAIAAGVAPDFAVMDQAPAERIARESAEEVLDALYRERPGDLRRLLDALDLSTQDDGPQPDLARSLLDVYEGLRVSGLRELPEPRASAEIFDAARGLALMALTDRAPVNTPKQEEGHRKLREWAAQFLALAMEPVTPDHFRLAKLGVNLGRLKKGSRARQAATDLKNDVLPGFEAALIAWWNAGLLDLLREAVARIAAVYRAKKRDQSALDFSDLEEESIRLLESNVGIRGETAGRFEEILMDEMQDTNRLQWRLLDLIRQKFFAVGDVNQSIYGFRYAESSVFLEYREHLRAAGGAVDDLRENHRSFASILNTVSRMLDGQPGIEPRPLLAVRGEGPQAVERLAGRGDDAIDAEASLVASRIRKLVDAKEYDFGDIAILVRTLRATEPFEKAFDRFDIPFLVSGGRTFLEAREIRDLLALLAALVNPLDDVALIGALRSPFAGISDEELFRAGREGWLREFDQRFGRLRRLAGFVAPDRLLAEAVDECGYSICLPDRARANIEKFIAHVRREHADRRRPLAELVDDLESLRAMQSEAEAPPAEAGDIVRLMSIHAAKGLEFPVVFISALQHGPDRRKPVIAFSSAHGLGAKWRNPLSGKGVSDTAHAAISEERKTKEEAEENRLLYVAMTRAKDRLYLSYAERRNASPWQKLAESSIEQVTVADHALDPPAPRLSLGGNAPAEGLLDPPEIPHQHDFAVAVTAVAQFHACPRKYLLGSVSGAPRPAAGQAAPGAPAPGAAASGGAGTGLGTGLAVHRILAGAPAESEEQAELAGRFTNSELGRRAARADRIEHEFDFVFSIGDVILRGQIDLWFEESGELILVDYKTDLEESSSATYALQLRLYALALERYAGRAPDRAVLYYLRTNRALEVSLEAAALDEARSAVAEFSHAQERLEFPLKPGEQCRRCGFFQNRCPAQLSPAQKG
ncbi:MAG TPA: UvrD-helicase domain-containing protein [Bryobacteraceae bacterium]|nr:UvrD-helicase domain-containing protein [Bryobacteraceae bacterium]